MAVTASTMLPLGTRAPDFALTDAVEDDAVALTDFDEKAALLVMFICNHCPYVQHVMKELGRFASDYLPKDLGIVAINSNSIVTHPQDGPEHMRALAEAEGWEFPFLFDSDQSVAKAYRAACTPDFFLFDGERRLVYRGQFDESRPGSGTAPTGKDLRAAADAVLAGEEISAEQTASIGCNIKWTPGNEPEYLG